MATPTFYSGNAMGSLGPSGSMMTNDQLTANKLGLPLMSGSPAGPGWAGNQMWGGMPSGKLATAMPYTGAPSSGGGAAASLPAWAQQRIGQGAVWATPQGATQSGGGTGIGGGSNFLSNIMQNQPSGVQMPPGISNLFSGLNTGGLGQSFTPQTGSGNSIFRPPGGSSSGGPAIGAPATSGQWDRGGGPGSGFYAGYDATPYGGPMPQGGASSPMQNLLSSVTSPAQTGTPSFAGPAPTSQAGSTPSQQTSNVTPQNFAADTGGGLPMNGGASFQNPQAAGIGANYHAPSTNNEGTSSPYINTSANAPATPTQQAGQPNPMLARGDFGTMMQSGAEQSLMNQIMGAPTNSMGGVQGQNPFINTTAGGGQYNVPQGLGSQFGSPLAALYQQQRGTPAFNAGMTSAFGNLYKPA